MAHEQNSHGLTPLLDVCTHWNSTYVMLEQALVCQEAYTGMLASTHYHLLLLTEGEWKRLAVLVQLLKGFKEYTNFAQAGISWATIGNTILIYNAIMEVLEKFMFIKTSNGKNVLDPKKKAEMPDLMMGAVAAYRKLRMYYS